MRWGLLIMALALFFAPAVAPTPSAADAERWRNAVRVMTEAPGDSVTVGQRMRVRYTAAYPDSLVLLPPGEIDAGESRMLSLSWSDGAASEGVVKRADLILLPLSLESARVPELPFVFLTPDGDTLTVYSEPVEVPVRHLIQAAEEPPRPLKPQWVAPPSYAKYAYIAAAIILAALAVLLLWRRRRGREVVAPPEPELPADFVALQELLEIERMNLLDEGRFKEYYTRVVDVLRRYLERRYGIMAMDRTSDEVIFELRTIRVHINELEPLFREADLVKFAKFKPDKAAGLRALETVRDIVVTTTPKPVAVEES